MSRARKKNRPLRVPVEEAPWLSFSMRRVEGGWELRVGNVPHAVIAENTLPGHEYGAADLALRVSKVHDLLEQMSFKGGL